MEGRQGFTRMTGGAFALAKKARWGALIALGLAVVQRIFVIPVDLGGHGWALSAVRAAAFFIAGTYVTMGYWACLQDGENAPGFDVFFRGANRTWLQGLLGTVIAGFPALLVGAASFGMVTLAAATAATRSATMIAVATIAELAFVLLLAAAAAWIMTRLALWVPALFSKHLSAPDALQDSFILTKGRFWTVFLWVMLPSLAMGILPRMPILRLVQSLLELVIVPILVPPLTKLVYDRFTEGKAV
jgi:hypothetical protein